MSSATRLALLLACLVAYCLPWGCAPVKPTAQGTDQPAPSADQPRAAQPAPAPTPPAAPPPQKERPLPELRLALSPAEPPAGRLAGKAWAGVVVKVHNPGSGALEGLKGVVVFRGADGAHAGKAQALRWTGLEPKQSRQQVAEVWLDEPHPGDWLEARAEVTADSQGLAAAGRLRVVLHHESAQAMWQRIGPERGLAELERFLRLHPDSRLAPRAERLRQKLLAAELARAEEELFQRLRQNPDLATCRRYLSEHPQGAHRGEVERLQEKLTAEQAAQQEREAFQQLMAAPSLEACRSYLRRFADSPRRKAVEARCGELKREHARRQDQRAYQRAQAQDTAKAYAAYLESFPRGAHREAAQQRLDELRQRELYHEAQSSKAPELCRAYLRQYPQGPQRREIEALLEEVLFRRWQKAGCDGRAVRQYLAEFPQGDHAEAARQRLNLIQAYGRAEEADTVRGYQHFLLRFQGSDASCYRQAQRRTTLDYWAQRQPRGPHEMVQIAVLLAGLKQLRQAESYLRKAVAAAPQDPAPQVELARLKLQQNDPAEAVRLARRAAERFPQSAQARFVLGEAWNLRQKPGKALKAFTEAVQLDRNCGECYLRRGMLHLHQLRRGQATQDFREGLAAEKRQGRERGWVARQLELYLDKLGES